MTPVADVPARDRDARRFWSKVSLPDAAGCMRWLDAGRDKDGYGRFGVYRPNGKYLVMSAHRYSCFLAYGAPEVPELLALHGCTTKDCVAPEHLYWGTDQRNADDRLRDGTEIPGIRKPNVRLTEAQILEIFRSSGPARIIAERFGIGEASVRHIRLGNRHFEITGKVR